MQNLQRRKFLKVSGLSLLPAMFTMSPALASPDAKEKDTPVADINFTHDGPYYSPGEYIVKLQQINQANPIINDVYGNGGVVARLQTKFTEITGKEAAIFMPTGTLANQLALSVLSGANTKVFVQETSHVFRDEGDSAQSVFNKRLVPLAKEETYFTLDQLKAELDYSFNGEVFKSGIGAVSIENPVRRANGKFVPLEEIKKISEFCRSKGYPLHLDGARIYLAAAFSGVSVSEYSKYFDTVYISMYKYLGAHGGAILCGSKAVIDKMEHLVKVHGGTLYMNWTNAAMALHHLDGLEERLKKTVEKSKDLIVSLNQIPEIKITPVPEGTNIFDFQLSESSSIETLADVLFKKHKIEISKRNRLMINETILTRDNPSIVKAFQESITQVRGVGKK